MVSKNDIEPRHRFWRNFIKASVWGSGIIALALLLMLLFLT